MCECVCLSRALTGEEVSYLFDEVAELLVALLHSLFALVGLEQDLLSVHFGLVCANFGLPHLNEINSIIRSRSLA